MFQFDGLTVKIRVPECLEAKYGETLECSVSPFPYGQDKLEQVLSTTGFSTNKKTGQQTEIRYGKALTHRFYTKELRWFWAITVDLPAPRRVTKPRQYGCIGIDINPKSIGYAVVDRDGNLVVKGRLPFDVSSKRRGQTLAIIAEVCNSLVNLALCYEIPICFENLDFSVKKAQLRERGRKYSRMLSNFAYSRFVEQLTLQCGNNGIELIQRNPAWSSFLALVKYLNMSKNQFTVRTVTAMREKVPKQEEVSRCVQKSANSNQPYNAAIVAVEMGGRSLKNFSHPKQCCYLLGAEDHGLPESVLERCALTVSIDAVNLLSYNVAVAGSIVMYDRLAKADNSLCTDALNQSLIERQGLYQRLARE